MAMGFQNDVARYFGLKGEFDSSTTWIRLEISKLKILGKVSSMQHHVRFRETLLHGTPPSFLDPIEQVECVSQWRCVFLFDALEGLERKR